VVWARQDGAIETLVAEYAALDPDIIRGFGADYFPPRYRCGSSSGAGDESRTTGTGFGRDCSSKAFPAQLILQKAPIPSLC
jgi:hypothetical protein